MYFGEMNIGIRMWFGRRVREDLAEIQENEKNQDWYRDQLSDPDVFEWVAEWYCEHIAEFVSGASQNTFCVDDIHNSERVGYRCKAVRGRCWEVVRMAHEALEEIKEAREYTNLEAWIEALHTDGLKWDGPSEGNGCVFVEDGQTFCNGARKRRVQWPRVCRTCGGQFRLEKGNAKNCAECRAKRRAGAS